MVNFRQKKVESSYPSFQGIKIRNDDKSIHANPLISQSRASLVSIASQGSYTNHLLRSKSQYLIKLEDKIDKQKAPILSSSSSSFTKSRQTSAIKSLPNLPPDAFPSLRNHRNKKTIMLMMN